MTQNSEIMKSKSRSINQIILVLVFGMIMMTANAQDNKSNQGNTKNPSGQDLSAPRPPSHESFQARPHHSPDMQQAGPEGREEFEEHRPILNLTDLTDVQKTAIKKVDLAFMPQITPLRKLVQADKAKLAALLAMQPADVTQTDNVADEIGKMVSKILKIMVQYDQSLRTTLSPDQQIIFDARPKPWLNTRL